MVGRKTQTPACCQINLGDCEGVSSFPSFSTKTIFGPHMENNNNKINKAEEQTIYMNF